MLNRKIMAGILVFIVAGLIVFSFANPNTEEPTPSNNQTETQNGIDAATTAVEKAETSLSQKDVDAARLLVNALTSSTTKTNLSNRLDLIQAIIDAIRVVEKAEITETQVDVNTARTLVNALPDGTTKTNLSNRLDNVQGIINNYNNPTPIIPVNQIMVNPDTALINALTAATAAVQKAETTKLQADVDAARLLVNALPDGTIKTDLINRLDAVQDIIDLNKAFEEATNAVVQAEESLLQVDVDAARLLVNALPDGTIKTDLTNRLDAVQDIIDLNMAKTSAITELSNYKNNSSLYNPSRWDTVQEFRNIGINNIIISTNIAEVINALNTAKANIDSVKTKQQEYNEAYILASEAVAKAEETLLQADVDAARLLVNALPDSADKNNLNNRLNAVEDLIALNLLKRSSIDYLNAYVTNMNAAAYSALNWSMILNYLGNGINAISNATSSSTIVLIQNNTINLINSILTIAQEQNNQAYQLLVNDATAKLLIVESKFKLNDYNIALNAVNLLNPSEYKSALLIRLAQIKMIIDDKVDNSFKNAVDALRAAENNPNDNNIANAIEKVNILSTLNSSKYSNYYIVLQLKARLAGL